MQQRPLALKAVTPPHLAVQAPAHANNPELAHFQRTETEGNFLLLLGFKCHGVLIDAQRWCRCARCRCLARVMHRGNGRVRHGHVTDVRVRACTCASAAFSFTCMQLDNELQVLELHGNSQGIAHRDTHVHGLTNSYKLFFGNSIATARLRRGSCRVGRAAEALPPRSLGHYTAPPTAARRLQLHLGRNVGERATIFIGGSYRFHG